MTDLHYRPAHVLAAMVRGGEISAAELLEHHLERIARLNPALNAIIWLDAEGARARAGAADAATARGESWGALHGVPITVKESFNLVGAPTTWGEPRFADNIATSNADLVDRYLGAGAVLMGKTNVPWMLGDWQSFNAIYGTTENPWAPGCTPGGSSGGAAVALATGMAALEAGTDIGASIRNPAHFCGVFGLKPSYGIVSYAGHALPGMNRATDITVAGPLARSAEDLALAFQIVAGPPPREALGWRLALPEAERAGARDFKVGVMLRDPNCAQDDGLTAALQNAVDRLAAAGVRIEEAELGFDTTMAHRLYLLLLRAETMARLSDEEHAAQAASLAARGPDDDSYRARIERGATLSHREWLRLDEARARLRQRWAAFFEDHDLLLCPSAASTAFAHDHEGERADRTTLINGQPELVVDQLFWAGLASIAWLPAAVAPAGLAADGLPCGLQIIGPYLHDKRCLAFARLAEDLLGGFTRPPGYE